MKTRTQTKIAIFLFSSLLFSTAAFAWVQFVAPVSSGVMWLGRVAAANVSMSRALEWSTYTLGAVITFVSWNNIGSTASTTTPIKATLVVSPDPATKRVNPDPMRWDDAATGRDPTPKGSFPVQTGLPQIPSTIPSVIQDIGGEGTKIYSSGTAPSTIYKVTATATKTAIQGVSSTWQGNVTVGGVTSYYYYYRTSESLTCPAGYSYAASTGICTLSISADQIQKPADKVPCEVIRNSNGTWEIDSKNPECTELSFQLNASSNSITYTRGTGDYDQITTNPDGGLTITTRGPAGNRDIVTQPYSSTVGGYTINSISDYPTAPTGSGSGSSGGSTTTGGGGNCGGEGQQRCQVEVNDIGFQSGSVSVTAAADAAIASLDQRQIQIEALDDGSTFGIDIGWIPSLLPGPPVQCQAIDWQPAINHGPLAGLTESVSFDLCDKVDVIREFLAWLFGVVTITAIALLFFGSNRPATQK